MNIKYLIREVYKKYRIIKLWIYSLFGRCVLEVKGRCPICEKNVVFRSDSEWLRDNFLCSKCASIPRERALMSIIQGAYPNLNSMVIHESSPGYRGVSLKLKNVCSDYTASHFYPNLTLGENHPTEGYRCENLENLTFADNVFDLFITQDVMEHVFNPEKAFKEIARVLKRGGAHIFTVPIINKENKSECWASKNKHGEIKYYHTPEYHGNPIDKKGSLVTMHWGYDLASYIDEVAGMQTEISTIENLSEGIRAEYIDVVISKKL